VNFSHRGSHAWKGNHVEYCFEVGKLTKLDKLSSAA
jgi:hypothetical protein